MAFSTTNVAASAAPFFPNALIGSVTAQSVVATSNDVAGVVSVTTSAAGTAASTLITTVGFQYPLPVNSAVQLTPRNALTGLAGGAAAAGWSAVINSSGQLEIRTGVATAAAANTYVFSYTIVIP
jgi:hypothetical protein